MAPTAAQKAAANKKAEAPEVEAVEAADAPEVKAPKKESVTAKRNRLRNAAERHIIEKYRTEFDDYAEQLFEGEGLTYQRRLSEEDKARKQIEKLIEENPALADVLRAKLDELHPGEAVTAESATGPVVVEAPEEATPVETQAVPAA